MILQQAIPEQAKQWDNRHNDPLLRMKWINAIEVKPADREKGKTVGVRIYPDGTQETFEVHKL